MYHSAFGKCSTPGQEPGWVPGQVIEHTGDAEGRALDDYTARELDVQEEEIPTVYREAQSLLNRLFSQVDGSTTPKHGVTGLGLAISKQLVEMGRKRTRLSFDDLKIGNSPAPSRA